MAQIGQETNGNVESKSLDPEQFRKLFIGGLSVNTTDDGLRQFYSQFGELLDCVVMRDNQTKKSRGFGFVAFSTKEEVDRAMAARPHMIDGRAVDPKRAVPRDQFARSESSISTKRLYVSGVREEHVEEDFSTHFSQFGQVLKVEIVVDKTTQKPRGFAFITFDDYDSVDKSVLHKSHLISGHRCDVKKALSKEDMAKAQQQDRDRQERTARSRGAQRGAPHWNAEHNSGGTYGGDPGGVYNGGYGGGARPGEYGGGARTGGYGGSMPWNGPQISGGWVAQPPAQWNAAAQSGYPGVYAAPANYVGGSVPPNWSAVAPGGGGWTGVPQQQLQMPPTAGGWNAGGGAQWTVRDASATNANNSWAAPPSAGNTWTAPPNTSDATWKGSTARSGWQDAGPPQKTRY